MSAPRMAGICVRMVPSLLHREWGWLASVVRTWIQSQASGFPSVFILNLPHEWYYLLNQPSSRKWIKYFPRMSNFPFKHCMLSSDTDLYFSDSLPNWINSLVFPYFGWLVLWSVDTFPWLWMVSLWLRLKSHPLLNTGPFLQTQSIKIQHIGALLANSSDTTFSPLRHYIVDTQNRDIQIKWERVNREWYRSLIWNTCPS